MKRDPNSAQNQSSSTVMENDSALDRKRDELANLALAKYRGGEK